MVSYHTSEGDMMTAQLTAPTIGAAIAFELAAERHGLEPDERYAAAELAAKAARDAGHELITTGDVGYAVGRILDRRAAQFMDRMRDVPLGNFGRAMRHELDQDA